MFTSNKGEHMKKIMTLIAAVALASTVFGMAKAPADDKACGAEKTCAVKDAASCCTTDGSCKTACAKEAKSCSKDAEACAKDAEACATKAVAEKTECAGGVCPLTK